ncbi:unnamed protein product [Prorocentrum cordatum]|uniref:RNA-editing substrate-binding complex 6 protein domain-containing protein n=1 Tax=Prorocentrum cordatum TaxID=2364126 RepID=A0ABN9WLP8_9DINO|nr:unnamed protein product [Polarella glacialis]
MCCSSCLRFPSHPRRPRPSSPRCPPPPPPGPLLRVAPLVTLHATMCASVREGGHGTPRTPRSAEPPSGGPQWRRPWQRDSQAEGERTFAEQARRLSSSLQPLEAPPAAAERRRAAAAPERRLSRGERPHVSQQQSVGGLTVGERRAQRARLREQHLGQSAAQEGVAAAQPLQWKEFRKRHWNPYAVGEVNAEPIPFKVQEDLVRARRLDDITRWALRSNMSYWGNSNIATCWHRLAKFADGPSVEVNILLNRLHHELEKRGIDEFNPSEVASIFYAMGALKWKREAFISGILRRVGQRLEFFSALQIAMITYALCRLSFRHEPFLKAVCEHVPTRLDEFDQMDISNLVCAMGRLKFSHRGFFEPVSESLAGKLHEFRVHDITRIVYAMSRCDFKHKVFLKSVLNELRPRLTELDDVEIVNALEALATLRVKHHGFAVDASAEVATRVGKLSSEQVERITNSLQVLQRGMASGIAPKEPKDRAPAPGGGAAGEPSAYRGGFRKAPSAYLSLGPAGRRAP